MGIDLTHILAIVGNPNGTHLYTRYRKRLTERAMVNCFARQLIWLAHPMGPPRTPSRANNKQACRSIAARGDFESHGHRHEVLPNQFCYRLVEKRPTSAQQ